MNTQLQTMNGVEYFLPLLAGGATTVLTLFIHGFSGRTMGMLVSWAKQRMRQLQARMRRLMKEEGEDDTLNLDHSASRSAASLVGRDLRRVRGCPVGRRFFIALRRIRKPAARVVPTDFGSNDSDKSSPSIRTTAGSEDAPDWQRRVTEELG
jgi:hypothetical protein